MSECAAEHVNDADKGRGVPLDSHSAVDLVVPEARPRNVESAVSLLHDDAVGDKLEVLIDVGDALEDLCEVGVHHRRSGWSRSGHR